MVGVCLSHTVELSLLARGGLSSTKGDRTRVTYFADEGVLFKTSACPRFVKEGYFFVPRYEVWGGENPLTIHEISTARTPNDSRSNLASKSAAAKQAEHYKI